MASEFPAIPPYMRKVLRRLKPWRSAHTGRLPIPEPLWAAAAELAREHGIFPTAKALRLEYGKPKQQMFSMAGPSALFILSCADRTSPGLGGRQGIV